MEFKSQTMRQVLATMQDTIYRWESASPEVREDLINPDAPIVVQCGDFGYEVQSIGGDGDISGFVMMVKEKPVCEWRDLEFISLKGN